MGLLNRAWMASGEFYASMAFRKEDRESQFEGVNTAPNLKKDVVPWQHRQSWGMVEAEVRLTLEESLGCEGGK